MAQLSIGCADGCVVDPDYWPLGVDYTVPADGHTYLWSFRIESDDPAAYVTLGSPNQVDHFTNFYGGDFAFGSYDFPYRFDQVVAPHLTTITVWAPLAYDNCASPGPFGAICGEAFNVWGNGTQLNYFGEGVATLYVSVTSVPEAATWAMLIIGFGLVGTVLRMRTRQWAVVAA
jgi:hypothetical protein